jgi:hypothetical protein
MLVPPPTWFSYQLGQTMADRTLARSRTSLGTSLEKLEAFLLGLFVPGCTSESFLHSTLLYSNICGSQIVWYVRCSREGGGLNSHLMALDSSPSSLSYATNSNQLT